MSEPPSMDRTRVTKSTLQEQGTDAFVAGATPAERMRMVWPLTLDAWVFKEPTVAQSRFQRHAVRVIRNPRCEVANDEDVTCALEALNRGEPLAAEQLLPLVYQELCRLARQKMAQEAAHHTLQPTALVHEAYLRLVGDEGAGGWENRGHFYAAAAEAMRRILIEAARRKASLKRGGNRVRVEIPEDLASDELPSADSLLALDEALKKLEVEDPHAYKLVMLRYFGGLSVDEAAAALGVSPRTAKRNWSFARAWLQREIERP